MWLWQSTECCHDVSIALHQDVTNCNKGDKRTVGFAPMDSHSSCFQFWQEIWSEWCLHNWQCISVTQRKLFCKKQNKKRSWQKEKKEKRSSTLAFLEVAWDIAKEILSDITRFYDRGLPYETVHAWCSPVQALLWSCSFVHICVISKFTDTLIVIYEGRAISAPHLTRLPYCGCQLNGDGWGHRQHCNPDSRAKQSDDFKWANLPLRTQANCSARLSAWLLPDFRRPPSQSNVRKTVIKE